MDLPKLHESKPPAQKRTLRGIASLYAVIFASILFGVIALSFIHIILSESRQSANDELSRSAYDSALAGVEDAKRAVNAYYACLNSGQSEAACASKKPFNDSCDEFTKDSGALKNALGYNVQGEIKIQEGSNAQGSSSETSTDQAYTCVIITDIADDYRATLTNSERVAVVPLGIASDRLQQVARIRFSWFSENNGTDINNSLRNLATDPAMKPKGSSDDAVPVISLTLLHTKTAAFDVNSFNKSAYADGDNLLYSTMTLLPAKDDPKSVANGAKNSITSAEITAAANSDQTKLIDGEYKNVVNTPFLITCRKQEYACYTDLAVSPIFQGNVSSNALLIVSMPYGGTVSDFKVEMFSADDKPIQFKGAQVSIDVTGRANQLLRRVETRLIPDDPYFPYPQNAIELTSLDQDSLRKNFWVTYNCWTEKGPCPDNGDLPN